MPSILTKFLLFAFLSTALFTLGHGQSLVPSGKYEMKRDKELNGYYSSTERSRTLTVMLTCAEGELAGYLVGNYKPGFFTGRAYNSRRHPGQTLVRLTQVSDDFYAEFVGHCKNGRIKGTWYTAQGDAGDFEMKLEK